MFTSNSSATRSGQLTVTTVPRGPNLNQFVVRAASSHSSNGAGVIAQAISDDPTGVGDFASIVNLYDLYRVEFMAAEWVPQLTFQTGVNASPLYLVFEPDATAATLASVAVALQYRDVQVKDVTKHWTVGCPVPRITSIPSTILSGVRIYEGGYLDTATPAGTCSIQWYGTGFNNSTAYGTFVTHLVLSCKDRR